MNRIPPVVRYTVLRLLAFAVPLTVLLFTPLQGWVSAVIAAIIGLCVSYIFLRAPRDTVARELYERRHGDAKPKQDDEDAEDAALDVATDDDATTDDALGDDALGDDAALNDAALDLKDVTPTDEDAASMSERSAPGTRG